VPHHKGMQPTAQKNAPRLMPKPLDRRGMTGLVDSQMDQEHRLPLADTVITWQLRRTRLSEGSPT
jgi:hypothetical protein